MGQVAMALELILPGPAARQPLKTTLNAEALMPHAIMNLLYTAMLSLSG